MFSAVTHLGNLLARLIQRVESHAYKTPREHDFFAHDADGFYAVSGDVAGYEASVSVRKKDTRRSAVYWQ